jgi:hypothetical protein
MSERPPVKDWATDFDHLDPRWVNDPYPIWDELRQKCPIAHTDRFKGVYLPTRYEDVRAIAYDPEHFSSRKVIVREAPPPSNNGAPPITSDPPRHRLARMVLLPPFTPQAIDKLVPKARQICNELIDGFAAKGSCDAAVEYAQHIPVKLIAHMLGIPESDGDRFRSWIKAVLEDGITDEAAMMRGFNEIREYFHGALDRAPQELRRRPHQLSHAAILSRRAPVHRQPRAGQRSCSSWPGSTPPGAASARAWHLAKTPEDRRRLVLEPALMRRHRGVPARLLAGDDGARGGQGAQINGCTFQGGPDGAAVLPAANRDPRCSRTPIR